MTSIVNPLAHLSDDELVAEHSKSGANSHFLSERDDDDPSRWTPAHLWALLLLAALVLETSLIAPSCLLGHGACR